MFSICLKRKISKISSWIYRPYRGYAQLTSQDVSELKSWVKDPSIAIIENEDEIASYNVDWTGKVKGNCKLVVCPATTDEVSKLLKYWNNRQIAIVPQGGNTGLVGGSIPIKDEIVISMKRMNKIHGFDKNYGVVKTDAGVILEKLMDYLNPLGYMMPIDLGARGSCHIGGNLATNAGGIKFIRYNSLHANTIGMKAVLADGTILDDMQCLRKNNTGYDLKQLFIGSEGTLGIITEAAILWPKIPACSNVAMIGCDKFEDVIAILSTAKEVLGANLSAIEYFDNVSNKMVKTMLNITNPLGYDFNFYVVVETSYNDLSKENEEDKAEDFIKLFEAVGDHAGDGIIAIETHQKNAIWKWRESIAEGYVKYGKCFKYDVSIPIDKFDSLVKELDSKVSTYAITGGYGHIGDGNIHINSSIKDSKEFGITEHDLFVKTEEIIEPWIFEKIKEYNGSISAEHGVGYLKAQYLQYTRNDEMIQTMRKFKKLLDPNGILSPYKLFPK